MMYHQRYVMISWNVLINENKCTCGISFDTVYIEHLGE